MELGITYVAKKKAAVKSLLEEILDMKTDDFAEGRPIILVPANEEDGNICLYNAQSLLENGIYVEPKAAKKQFFEKHGGELTNKVFIKKTIKDKEVVFEIRNKVENHHWKRVVATFLLGPEWQFRDWCVEEKPVTLFLKGMHNRLTTVVRAFYLKYADAQAHINIAKWNVKNLQINRVRRYLDQSTQTDFWKELESFIVGQRVKTQKDKEEKHKH